MHTPSRSLEWGRHDGVSHILGSAMREYHQHLLATDREDSTIKHRMRQVEKLAQRIPLYQATTEDLEAILGTMRLLAPETRKSTVAGWRVFYRWAHATGRIDRDPTATLARIRVPVRVPKLAPDDQVQTALITASLRDRGLILLGRLACLRLTELTTLPLKAREGDYLRVIGKGDKERIVYINDDLMPVLHQIERLNVSGYYFPGRYGGHMHPMSVNKIITRVTGCNPHSLRHAGATAAYRATRDLRAVQEMLGHASLATTQRYLHLDDDARRAAAQGTGFTSAARSPHFSHPRIAA